MVYKNRRNHKFSWLTSDRPAGCPEVNLLTGPSTFLGRLAECRCGSYRCIQFRSGWVLYALDPLGDDFIINSHGAGILIGNTGGQYWPDLTIASPILAVTEPNSMALLLITALGLMGLRTAKVRRLGAKLGGATHH